MLHPGWDIGLFFSLLQAPSLVQVLELPQFPTELPCGWKETLVGREQEESSGITKHSKQG